MRLPLLSCLLWGLAAACSTSEASHGGGLEGRLTLTGSSTVAPLVSDLAKRFEALHPGLRVDVQAGGSSRGIADVASGLADVGMSSRALTSEERTGRVEHVLARDGVAFVVHAENAVPELTREQLVAVLTGAVDDWGQVGGAPGPITVVDRARGRSEVSLVTAYLGIEPRAIAADAVGGENLQVVRQVGDDPAALSFLSVGTASVAIEEGVPLRLLPLDGVDAKPGTVADGSYPLARPLLLLTGERSSAGAHAFVEFARSARVHDLVREHSFVPLAR